MSLPLHQVERDTELLPQIQRANGQPPIVVSLGRNLINFWGDLDGFASITIDGKVHPLTDRGSRWQSQWKVGISYGH